MGAPVGTVLYGDVTPRWVVHGYTHAMVVKFSKVVVRRVRDVVEVWWEIRFPQCSWMKSLHAEEEVRREDSSADTNLPKWS